MTEQTKALIQVAVAYVTGSEANMEQQVAEAKRLGVTLQELVEGIQVARQVWLTTIMGADASIQIAVESDTVVEDDGSSCGCGSGRCC